MNIISPYSFKDLSPISLFQQDIESNFNAMVGTVAQPTVSVLVVGAWRGDEINSFLAWPNIGDIYAFEPNPDNFQYLESAFKGNHKVRCLQLACGDTDGEAVLHSHNTESGTDSLLPTQPNSPFKDVLERTVRVVRLDSLPELKTKQFDLLWIDVQGFELAVLRGAQSILKDIKAIYIELNGTDTPYKGAPHYEEIDSFLKSKNFALAHSEMGQNPHADGGVGLYVKKELHNNYFSPELIRYRLPVLVSVLEKRNRLTNSFIYRVGRKILPIQLKSFIKRWFR